MNNIYPQHSPIIRRILATVIYSVMLMTVSACSREVPPTPISVSGGRSAVLTIDLITNRTPQAATVRNAALLGLFVSEYIATSAAAQGVEGALLGVGVQSLVMETQGSVSDPDFDLLQAFADALQVDIADLLNRSPDRQQSLDIYANALTNVATKANDRYKQVLAASDQLKSLNRDHQKTKNTAERELRKALDDKEFTEASEKQKSLLQAQQALAESDLKLRELTELSKTLDKLLTLYGEKILAIEQNREILISGMRVVDVPGIEDLKIIQRKKVSPSRTRNEAEEYDALFK